MNKTHIIEIETIWLLVFAGIIGFVFAFYTRGNLNTNRSFALPIVQKAQGSNFNSSLSQAPIPTNSNLPKPQISTQISPDGTKLLTMTRVANQNTTKTYTFTTSGLDSSNQHQIYSVTYGVDSMTIPFNTWSPDDNYVFINHLSSVGNEALVFKADGTPISSTDNFFNATQIFSSKITDNLYMETTGWASPTLLIINSKKQDGTKSTSYWLEIPSKAVIPLASQF